jgi:hypothetical protein
MTLITAQHPVVRILSPARELEALGFLQIAGFGVLA